MCYLREFRTFVAVYEECSFTAAASRMNATQSGISQQIKKIEQVVGVRLFDRGTRTVKPTMQGDLYYTHCLRLLREYDEAISTLQTPFQPDQTRRICLGIVPWLSRCILPPLLQRFADAYPDVVIEVEEASADVLDARLRDGHLRFIITEDELGDTATFSEGTVSQCVVVTGRHERSISRHIHPEEIASRNLILPPMGNPIRMAAERMFAQYGLRPAKLIEINSISAAINLAIQSGWSAFVPIVALIAETATINCVADSIIGEPGVGVVVRSRRASLSPIEQKFREQLNAELSRFALNTPLIAQAFSVPAQLKVERGAPCAFRLEQGYSRLC